MCNYTFCKYYFVERIFKNIIEKTFVLTIDKIYIYLILFSYSVHNIFTIFMQIYFIINMFFLEQEYEISMKVYRFEAV